MYTLVLFILFSTGIREPMTIIGDTYQAPTECMAEGKKTADYLTQPDVEIKYVCIKEEIVKGALDKAAKRGAKKQI